jgi:hypothetical protein
MSPSSFAISPSTFTVPPYRARKEEMGLVKISPNFMVSCASAGANLLEILRAARQDGAGKKMTDNGFF